MLKLVKEIECGVGFEPTKHGFADRFLKPLGHPHISKVSFLTSRRNM